MLHKSCLSGRLGAVGFTLIELLVVVLIIGILAAVALPKYQKAIEKSKSAQALVLLKSLGQAQEAHYAAVGDYATDWAELSVGLPADFRAGGTFFTWRVKNPHTNGQWVAVFSANQSPTEVSSLHGSIFMGHPSGHSYQGAGFLYKTKSGAENLYPGILGSIVCLELKQDAIFRKNQGDFCQKLFGGTLYHEYDGFRLYTLP